MNFRDTPDESRFRASVRDWIAANLRGPSRVTAARANGASSPAAHERDRRRWPSGANASNRRMDRPAWPHPLRWRRTAHHAAVILKEEMALARAPRFGGVGIGWVAPTLMQFGADG